jgi:DNA-binding LytR/AlgR family response regulator
MNKIKCAIIDDEPYTASVLEAYISELDTLELVGTFYNPIDALVYLQRYHVDLVFMDIMLPKVTGEAFLKLLPSRPKVIFLSSSKKRWIPGSDQNILDCLFKPIAFEAFLNGIDRVYAAIPPALRRRIVRKRKPARHNRGPFVYLFSAKTTVKVFLNEVIYIEGVRNYSRIKTTDREIVVFQGIAAIDERLMGRGFIKIHRAFIVPIAKITAFTSSTVEIGIHILPVSAPYRKQLTGLIKEGLKKI